MSEQQEVLVDIQIKLAKIETTLEMLATSERMASVEADTKTAHKRLNSLEIQQESDKNALSSAIDRTEKRIYWIAGTVFTVAQVLISFFTR